MLLLGCERDGEDIRAGEFGNSVWAEFNILGGMKNGGCSTNESYK